MAQGGEWLLKAEFPFLPVLLCAADPRHSMESIRAGADVQVRETFESAVAPVRMTGGEHTAPDLSPPHSRESTLANVTVTLLRRYPRCSSLGAASISKRYEEGVRGSNVAPPTSSIFQGERTSKRADSEAR